MQLNSMLLFMFFFKAGYVQLFINMEYCRGCLLERQLFFHDDVNNISDMRGCVRGCRGFRSSLRTTQGGLSLNIGMLD